MIDWRVFFYNKTVTNANRLERCPSLLVHHIERIYGALRGTTRRRYKLINIQQVRSYRLTIKKDINIKLNRELNGPNCHRGINLRVSPNNVIHVSPNEIKSKKNGDPWLVEEGGIHSPTLDPRLEPCVKLQWPIYF